MKSGQLRREAEMHDVAVLHDIILALEPHLSGIARTGFAAARHVIVVGDGFGADEAALEIGVDDARGLRRLGAAGHRPGARLLRPGSEEGYEIKQPVAGADQAIEARLLEADGCEVFVAFVAARARRSRLRSWPR